MFTIDKSVVGAFPHPPTHIHKEKPPRVSAEVSSTRQLRRYADDPIDMLVDEHYEKNVGYFVGEYEDAETGELFREPSGTVFFVRETVHPGGYGYVNYAVTCRHVLEGASGDPGFRRAFIRVNNRQGKHEDIPSNLEDWCAASDTDVALTRFDAPDGIEIWANHIANQMNGIMPGHEVFLVGMFYLMPGAESVQALVRSGRVARSYVDCVPITLNPHMPDDLTNVTAHLIEAFAWGGQSGSPVYIHDQYHVVQKPRVPDQFGIVWGADEPQRSKVMAMDVWPPLLGILYGNFNMPKAVTRGNEEIGGVEVNSGIAIVIPVEKIRELLWAEKLVEDRERIMQERKALNIAKGLAF